jgi:hypothetical protein
MLVGKASGPNKKPYQFSTPTSNPSSDSHWQSFPAKWSQSSHPKLSMSTEDTLEVLPSAYVIGQCYWPSRKTIFLSRAPNGRRRHAKGIVITVHGRMLSLVSRNIKVSMGSVALFAEPLADRNYASFQRLES